MALNVFERKELKYLIKKAQYEALLEKLHGFICRDEYFNYQISNIYYDTENYDLFRASQQKPLYKEKLRLRSYGIPSLDDESFIEIKKKYEGTVYKRRITMPLEASYAFIDRKGENAADINAKEISVMLNRYELHPQVYLSYDRYAYFWKTDIGIRITFDYSLRYRRNDLRLEAGDHGDPIIPEDLMILEIKLLHAMPLPLAETLTALEIFPISFSKIGHVYEEHIIKPSLHRQNIMA